MNESDQVLLDMQGIYKSFIGVDALKGVNLTIGRGEVHALAGENGAGKSVLIKILTGIHQKDGGKIIFDGKEVNFSSPAQAQHAGIRPIYQELNTVPYLSVAENMFLGNEIRKKGIIDWKQTNKRAQEILCKFGINIDVNCPIMNFGAAVQQMISIAMAVSLDAKLIIMDEATSSLDEKEVGVLLNIVRKLKEDGISVIFITHRMNEIYEVCDKITILKDGEYIGQYKTSELSKIDLVSKMIGRDATSIMSYRKEFNPDIKDDDIILEVQDLNDHKCCLNGMNFQVKRGEILGLAGLLGSGRTESAKAIFGAHPIKDGKIKINGKYVRINNPRSAIKNKIALCPEERKTDAIFPDMSVRDNMVISVLKKISKFGFISGKKADEMVDKYIKALKIKTPNSKQLIKFLSGGNQQKVILGRWLGSDPELIILDEPTRGIDVGAKTEMENLIREIAVNEKISVIMISSILEELVRDCDRIVVIREGENIAMLMHNDISESKIIHTISEAHNLFQNNDAKGDSCPCQ
jgi:monosaccharide-transporting ATPase